MSKRILVTGVAGFIGSNLAIELIRIGYTVIGIDNLSLGSISVFVDNFIHKLCKIWIYIAQQDFLYWSSKY